VLPVGRRDIAMLVALGVAARALTAALIHQPGYIDTAYYYDVARNVAAGRGLMEDFIVTYLAPAPSVVHASNLWWMPGASLVIVPFFWLFGAHWWVAELPNVLLTGSLPALGYLLGRELVGTRRVALGAGLLTITSGFYYPLYDPMPDNFGLYAWAAGGALLLMSQGLREFGHAMPAGKAMAVETASRACIGTPLRGAEAAAKSALELRWKGWDNQPWRFALAGLCCGVAHLARSEAPLLLVIALGVWWRARWRDRASAPVWALGALFGGYLLLMAPWFVRNLLLIGAPLPGGGLQSAWLRQYDDFFSYGLHVSASSYLAWGLGPIVGSKIATLATTLRQLAAVMDFALAPFALLGMWRLRRVPPALPWLLYAAGAFLALDLVFTFPSTYGTVLHSEVAVLPYLNVAAIVGLDAVLDWVGRRSESARRTEERKRVYVGLAVGLSAVLSAFLIFVNAHAWDATASAYAAVGRVVAKDAARAGGRGAAPVVMVADPANYYYQTDEHAIVLPDQPLPVMAGAAQRYGARYLVLEPVHTAAQNDLWSGRLKSPLLTLIWSGQGIRLYRWNW
jgi:hypothetical protein